MTTPTLPPAVRAMFKPPFKVNRQRWCWDRITDRVCCDLCKMPSWGQVAYPYTPVEGMPSREVWRAYFRALCADEPDLDEICKRLNEAWETSA